MLIYEKKVHQFNLKIIDKDNILAGGKVIVEQSNDYNYNEMEDKITIKDFSNKQLPNISKEDIEQFLNDKGIEDMEAEEIKIDKEDIKANMQSQTVEDCLKDYKKEDTSLVVN